MLPDKRVQGEIDGDHSIESQSEIIMPQYETTSFRAQRKHRLKLRSSSRKLSDEANSESTMIAGVQFQNASGITSGDDSCGYSHQFNDSEVSEEPSGLSGGCEMPLRGANASTHCKANRLTLPKWNALLHKPFTGSELQGYSKLKSHLWISSLVLLHLAVALISRLFRIRRMSYSKGVRRTSNAPFVTSRRA